MKSFASDNYAGVLPEVMQALTNVNSAHARSYGADDVTARTINILMQQFDADIEVLFVFNGTGANVLSIAASAASHQSVLCADTSHIYNDESSAPETFTGCRIFTIAADSHGKLSPETVAQKIIRKGDVHFAQPKLLSITQSTEYGTVYTKDEIQALSTFCKQHDLYLHVDGSRFFNAAASMRSTLKELSTDVGVDILSLGGTKAGMMFGEAVIVFNPALKEAIRYKQKQVMQLHSKTRFIAAQFEALLQDELWRTTATHANAMAALLATELTKIPQVNITKPVQANAVFAEIPAEWNKSLMAKFPFYVWKEDRNEVRLMCGWDTQANEIKAFIQAIRELASL